MKIMVFGASLRKGSLNKKFAARVAESLKNFDAVEVDLADFREFEMPVYDGDIEEATGIPDGAKKLIQRITNADALVISTPEYNGGMPGALKNAVDWVSRHTPAALSAKPLLLVGASPGALGAVRGLWHSRVPFEALGTLVFPEMFGLSKASSAFAENGEFLDVKNQERLGKLLNNYVRYAKNLKMNPQV